MNEPPRAVPLSDVLDIVERRRRGRARTRTLAGYGLSVAAAGVAALIVVALQPGPDRVQPATPALFTTAPATRTTSPATSPAATPRPAAPPFDPAYLQPHYLNGLADSILTGGGNPADVRKVDDATALAAAWGVPLYPAAKAVAAKAALTGTTLHPTDPHGGDELVSRFEQAGYTDAYAEVLAKAWSTDPRTAEIVGALVIEAGCCTK